MGDHCLIKTLLTSELQETMVKLLEDGVQVKHACEYVRISEGCYYNWFKRGEKEGKGIYYEFMKSCSEARAKSARHAIVMIRKATLKDWRAAAWFLERAFPKQWGPQDSKLLIDNSDKPKLIRRQMPGPRDKKKIKEKGKSNTNATE